MAKPFNDDINRGPDLPRTPWYEWKEFKDRNWVPPELPRLPSPPLGPRPWWLDPSAPQTPPSPAPGSNPWWMSPPPSTVPGAAPEAWRPINSAPAALGAAAIESAGGLLGMLSAMVRQGEPMPQGGVDSNPQDASQDARAERRLGRRTYRP
jgi:hypothetical protein